MASITLKPDQPSLHLPATEVYRVAPDTTSPIALRIATGGAGQSGLLKALAEAYIAHRIHNTNSAPFAIAWSASDTSLSFNALALRGADLSITYHPAAEQVALEQGIAERREYAWRDHWMLVGPSTNPANLSTDNRVPIYTLFTQLFKAAIATQDQARPVRFLSRYDKSANNIKESAIWAAVGQTPWAVPYSSWYHQSVQLPFQALETAAKLGEYMITDKGTWVGVGGWVREKMMVFKEGGDGEDDPLLNPAHALVGSSAENKEMANDFVDWLIESEGGQKVIREFKSSDGTVFYSAAPPRINRVVRPRL